MNVKAQSIQSGLRTQIQDQLITLHSLSPTKRTVRIVLNNVVPTLMLVLSICFCIVINLNNLVVANRFELLFPLRRGERPKPLDDTTV